MIKPLSGFLTVAAVLSAGWGGNAYVEAKVEKVEANARAYSEAAYKSARLVHAVDYWEGRVVQQQRYIDHLRASGAPMHVIQQAEKELDYFTQEMWSARKEIQ